MNLGQRFFARPWWAGSSLIFLGLAVYLIPNIFYPLTRAEAMYALIPQEMLASGQWLTPTLNGAPYLDKPPLLYWLTGLVYKIFGVSDGAARLPTSSTRGAPRRRRSRCKEEGRGRSGRGRCRGWCRARIPRCP